MKRILFILLAFLMLFACTACEEEQPPVSTPPTNEEPAPVLNLEVCYTAMLEKSEEPTLFVQFEIEGGATFVVELYPEYAPETVANFQSLVAEGFYDGLTFHRIIEDFMIQGGCPNGDGTGSSQTKIKGEFSTNGFAQNTLKHERGVISMARSNAPDSASCQFFIMHEAASHLDGKYAAFGRVVAGMETVDAIAGLPVERNPYSTEKSKPVDKIVMERVTFVNYTAE